METLLRQFTPTESNFPFIIPALKNGMKVEVTKKIAQEFRLVNPALIVKGKVHTIQFTKGILGLIVMTLDLENK
jgi:hypothetical protein